MKNTMMYLGALVLFISIACNAVEKKEKPAGAVTPPTKTTAPATPKKVPAPVNVKRANDSGKKQTTSPTAAKKFDDFIDKNHNGVDDRKENLVKKDDPKASK